MALVNGDNQRSDAREQPEGTEHYQVDRNEAFHGTLVQEQHACSAFNATQPIVASGVAGPLAAQGGGQICRPFTLLGRPFAAKNPT